MATLQITYFPDHGKEVNVAMEIAAPSPAALTPEEITLYAKISRRHYPVEIF